MTDLTLKRSATAEMIALYGDKRLQRYVSKHKVKYSLETYRIASKLASIDEAFVDYYYNVGDPKEYRRLIKLHKQTCRELERAIKLATKRGAK